MKHNYRQGLRAVRGLLLVLFAVLMPATTPAYNRVFGYKSAIVMDCATGRILYEEDAHVSAIPASLVKMMLLYLTMQQIEAGRLHFTDLVTVSAWASKIGGQQVSLQKGEVVSLAELIKAMVIASANDAATAIAEFLAGSPEACVVQMNAAASALGMEATSFANVHGLPRVKGQKDNVTTAHDLALLARELLRKYPQILVWTSTVIDTFRNGTLTLTNTNQHLLQSYPGVDGLKTGFIAKAGFTACVTAKREERRLIVVIMDAPTKGDRDRAVRHLLDRGFKQIARMSDATMLNALNGHSP